MKKVFSSVLFLFFITSCTSTNKEGPDKQFEGEIGGAAIGAGAGAITGFHVGAGAGPGAAVGAGFGAVAGGIQGFLRDQTEENLIALANETQAQRKRAIAQEILSDHYKKRMEIHPSRDIYPADLFFEGDEVKLRECSKAIVHELALMNQPRMPWSRIEIAVYVKAADKDSNYAAYISKKRAIEIGDEMVNAGIEPRRIETKAVIVQAPVVVDPDDAPGRYNQAIELVTLDR
jgi:hypothetical protein